MNLKTLRTKLILAALAATLTCSALTLPGEAADLAVEPETLAFRGVVKAKDTAFHDVRPRGDSLGDRSIASMTLRRAGQIAGRLEGVCTTIDNTYDGHMCTLVVILADGRLAFEGAGVRHPVPNVGGRGDRFALTGGTGRYVGADGTLTVAPGDNGDRIVITID